MGSAAEVGADTLQQRLPDELAAATAVFAHPMLIGAWYRLVSARESPRL